MDSSAAPAKNTSQPQAAMQMDAMKAGSTTNNQQCLNKAERVRGGGAGKDCLLGCLGCFLCFECCEGCCDCAADILCCPCEMCC